MPASPTTTRPTASHRITLPDGRALAVDEYGAPDGRPLLFIHGWPSAAVQGALLHHAARDLGLRVIAPSRPGLASSHPQAGRTLRHWPQLVRETAAALGLERLLILGVSGGGPYALAAAAELADLVEAVAVVCGAPPLIELGSSTGFNPAYRSLLAFYRQHRGAARWLFRLLHPLARRDPPQWLMTMLRGSLVAPDRETLADPEIARLCSEGFRTAWGEYRDGVFEDAEIYAQPWGLALEDIRIPVRVWHGMEDRNFSHLLVGYAQRIPGVELRILPDEGHYSLPIRRAPEILADLAAAGPRPAGTTEPENGSASARR